MAKNTISNQGSGYVRIATTVFAGFLLVPASMAAAGNIESDLRAVITQVEGMVTVNSGTAAGGIRRVRPLEIVAAGVELHVPDGGRAGLVCSSEHWIELSGARKWTVSGAACAAGGRVLPHGTFRSLAPRGGRFRTVDGILVMELDVRGDAEEALVLSPRQTAVLDQRPVLRWRQVPGAVEYEIELTGLAKPRLVDASEVPCRVDPAWDGVRVCSLPFPQEHPGLEAGRRCYLNVGYREGIASPLHKGKKGWRIKRLPAEEVRMVRERLAAIGSLPVGGTARALARAGVYAEHGLYADAIAAYREVLRPDSAAATRVTLADLYFKVELDRWAYRHYEEVSTASDEPGVLAAAALGLGRVHYARGGFPEARDHFRQAEALYARLGLTEEQAAARAAAAAEKRILD